MKLELDENTIEGEHWTSLWGAVYGNLMSCVAIFFLLMFISSRSSLFQQAIDAISSQFGGTPAAKGRGGNVLSAFAVDEISKLDIKENRMKIVFGDPVLFESGRAELKTSAFPHLQRLAKALREVPNPIQVEGHTDDRPLAAGSPFHSNWELSAARAFSVLKYLQQQGVPPSRLSAIGYGEWRPLRPNDSPANRSINRRIEIELVRLED